MPDFVQFIRFVRTDFVYVFRTFDFEFFFFWLVIQSDFGICFFLFIPNMCVCLCVSMSQFNKHIYRK